MSITTEVAAHTLHQAVSKKFDKTPSGRIFTRDIKMIFSLLLICLQLREKPKQQNSGKLMSSLLQFSSKQFPFSFALTDAITTMGHLSSTIESSATKTTISYAIKPELAAHLIGKFMDAKLIHTPADRTRSEPKEKVLLQPTPKGVAVLQGHCKMFGFKSLEIVPILQTSFNSMDLFVFERSGITDNIVYSEYFIHLLFARFIGPEPNVWSSYNPPDELPLDHRISVVDEFEFSHFQNEFTSFEQYQQVQHVQPQQQRSQPQQQNRITSLISVKNKKPCGKERESPFHHNFFTNPESDSHIQYYVSNKGVRLYKDHKFGSTLKVPYCFNAKAAWQWLMDCTDTIYPNEAVTVLNLFYKYALIEPIIVAPSTASSKRRFAASKTSFYTLSQRGKEVANWAGKSRRRISRADDDAIIKDASALALNDSNDDVDSFSDNDHSHMTTDLDIKKVLTDPGMRYLFRTHLEREYCAENLDAYIDIRQFVKKMTILESLLEAHTCKVSVKVNKTTTIKPPSKKTLVKLVNECLSGIYNIYSSYITIGAPYELNIDHLLRKRVAMYMMHSTSPLKAHFPESCSFSNGVVDNPANGDDYGELKFPEQAHTRAVKSSLVVSVESTSINDRSLSTTPIQNRRSNNNELSIDIIKHGFAGNSADMPKTPTEQELSTSLDLLYKLTPLIEEIGKQILRMLEYDSFPKFIKSDTFNDANLIQ